MEYGCFWHLSIARICIRHGVGSVVLPSADRHRSISQKNSSTINSGLHPFNRMGINLDWRCIFPTAHGGQLKCNSLCRNLKNRGFQCQLRPRFDVAGETFLCDIFNSHPGFVPVATDRWMVRKLLEPYRASGTDSDCVNFCWPIVRKID